MKKKYLKQIAGLVCARCNKNEYLLMNIDGMLWTICKVCGMASPIFSIGIFKSKLEEEPIVEKRRSNGVQ